MPTGAGESTYLTHAVQCRDAMLKSLTKQKMEDLVTGFVGFQWSHTGMLCVAAAVAQAAGEDPSAYVAQVAAVFTNLSVHTSPLSVFTLRSRSTLSQYAEPVHMSPGPLSKLTIDTLSTLYNSSPATHLLCVSTLSR